MKEIELTQNKIVLVDDNDYEDLKDFKWYCMKNKMGGYYASTVIYGEGKLQKTILMHRLVLNAPKGFQLTT